MSIQTNVPALAMEEVNRSPYFSLYILICSGYSPANICLNFTLLRLITSRLLCLKFSKAFNGFGDLWAFGIHIL